MNKALDAMRKALEGDQAGARSESETSESALLSDMIADTNGYLSPDVLQQVLDYAKMLQSLGRERSDEHEAWLLDFMTNIGTVLEREREMEALVDKRRAKNRPSADMSLGLEDASSTMGVNRAIAGPRNKQEANVQTLRGDQARELRTMVDRPLPEAPFQPHLTPQPRTPTIKLNELAHRPDKFDGRNDKAYRWIEDYEAAALANQWSDDLMVKYISAFLEKSARDWYAAILQPKLSRFSSWTEVRRHFIRFYVGPEELDSIRDEVRKLRQGQEERVTEFIARSLRLMRVGYPDQSERERVKELKLKLRHQYKERLIGQKLETLEDLNDLCLEIEQHMSISNVKVKQQQLQPHQKAGTSGNTKNDSKTNRRGQNKKKSINPTNSNENPRKVANPQLQCNHCKKIGHTVEFCWAKNGKPERKPKVTAIVGEQPQPPNLNKVTTIRNVCSAATDGQVDHYVMQKVKLNGINVNAMLDSGSRLSFIRAEIARRIGAIPDGSFVDVVGANSQRLNCEGRAVVGLDLLIGTTRKLVDCQFVVMQDLCVDVLIGNELMALLNLAVEPKKRKAFFVREGKGLRVSNKVKLDPRSQAVIRVEAGIGVEPRDVIMTTNINIGSSLLVANSIDQVDDDGCVNCLVVNLEDKYLEIGANTQIAGVQHVSSEESDEIIDTETSNATLELGNTAEVVQVGDQLNENQVEDLRNLLSHNFKAFSLNGRIGETNLIEHDIELVDGAQPVVEPLRRRPLTHREECERQVKIMLKDGIIEQSSSPWAAAYVVVKKKTGDSRICIDFRRLNALTRKNKYPLPNIEDCLEPLSGNIYYSQLDLASGYWQIQVAEKAREKTAFRTESGHYQFRRMPFGLTNAPASFQRLVNALFTGLTGVHLQVFIDDLCLASQNWSDHLRLIEQVLKILQKANLTLKASKCVFGASRVIFLGHELSRDGIRQDPTKISAIEKMAAPKTAQEIQRVLGLFNYYRRFVPCFSSLAEPLTRLTRKGIPFEWNKEQNDSFESLKSKLTSNVLLGHFNHHDPLTLKTDASRVGIAGILLQRQDNEWRMITACSRRLSSAEERYGITDLEALAIVYSVGKLRNYVLGKHFTILTDHCPLCSIKNRVPKSPRLYRWSLLLDEYDFSIQYIKGGLHSDVDCLSRSPVDDIDDELSEKVLAAVKKRVGKPERCTLIVPQDAREWRLSTEQDAEGVQHLAIARKRTKGYKIFNGCLYFEDRLFVPAVNRDHILAENHSDSLAGHGGVRATAERMTQFWWPTMATDIAQYVASCQICQARKAQRQPPMGEMRSFRVLEPFQLVAIDALGPLPPSIANKRHVFVAVDCFTRYTFAMATEDVKQETAVAFLRSYVSAFGIANELITDNAPTFVNSLVNNFLTSRHMTVRHATAGHHEGNSMVERTIQTLQDKLALITHDPASSSNWEDEIDVAVISMNTTVHSSTGYTPFELLFGTAHLSRSLFVNETRDEMANFVMLQKLAKEKSHAYAVGRQSDNRNQAKKRFDESHRQVQFTTGDKVMARVLGRRTKLQNRFVGPYQIAERKGDVYRIVNCEGRNENLDRHVNDLKLFKDRLATIVDTSVVIRNGRTNINSVNFNHNTECMCQMKISYITAIWFTYNIVAAQLTSSAFKEAPLVSWAPTRIYSSPGPITFKLAIRIGSACDVLRQFRASGLHQVGYGKNQHQVNLAQLQGQPRYDTKVYAQGQQGVASQQQSLTIAPYLDETELAVQQCEQVHHELIMSPIQALVRQQAAIIIAKHANNQVRTELNRTKRGIGQFFLGSVVGDVFETLVERVFTSNHDQDLTERDREMAYQMGRLAAKHNFTQLQIAAMREASTITAQLVSHNIQELREIRLRYPQLAVVAANIVARSHIFASNLERVLSSFRLGRPDLEALYSIYKLDPILDIDADSIERASVAITALFDTTLQVTFTARQKSADTMVYQVFPFKYFERGPGQTKTLKEYIGPRFLLYNSRENCATGIVQPSTTYVSAQCNKRNHVDSRLTLWRPVNMGSSDDEKDQTEVFEVYPVVRVNCYGQTITRNNKTTLCPMFPFEMDASEPWHTPTYEYAPSAVEYHTIADTAGLQDVINNIHLRNVTGIPSKERALQRVDDLLVKVDDLEKELEMVHVAGKQITWQHATHALSISNIAFLTLLAYLLYTRAKHYVSKSTLINRIQEEERNANFEMMRQQRRRINQLYAQTQHRSNSIPMIEFPDNC